MKIDTFYMKIDRLHDWIRSLYLMDSILANEHLKLSEEREESTLDGFKKLTKWRQSMDKIQDRYKVSVHSFNVYIIWSVFMDQYLQISLKIYTFRFGDMLKAGVDGSSA
ncbi:hypothetical protein THRCLA_20196 [Thraustotheca clavata]|uniref:Uncharacterized protein n=1 Tax=Thraustotheca clavata TaxID=74557 RepID=A0A1W0AAH3_9STRA|nr:hypothetical protein THRCLA_20196 [Thraustotheca clavata]